MVIALPTLCPINKPSPILYPPIVIPEAPSVIKLISPEAANTSTLVSLISRAPVPVARDLRLTVPVPVAAKIFRLTPVPSIAIPKLLLVPPEALPTTVMFPFLVKTVPFAV